MHAVLFDLDDTITDRSATIQAYAGQFLSDFEGRFRLTDLPSVAAEIARIDRNGYNAARAADLARHDAWISSPGTATLAAHWDHYFVECTQARAHLGSTVTALARARIRLGIVTNGRTDKQRRKVELIDLRDRIGALLISEEVGFAKPSEQIFRAAAGELGVAPHQCLFIGDNPKKDVCGAAAVGMRAVWFRSNLTWPPDLSPPTESIASLQDVPGLLGLSLRTDER